MIGLVPSTLSMSRVARTPCPKSVPVWNTSTAPLAKRSTQPTAAMTLATTGNVGVGDRLRLLSS